MNDILTVLALASLDLFSDGLLVGIGSMLSIGLGFLLTLRQVPGDVPEGFGTIATFKRQSTKLGKRLLPSASLALLIVAAATLSYWAVQDAPCHR